MDAERTPRLQALPHGVFQRGRQARGLGWSKVWGKAKWSEIWHCEQGAEGKRVSWAIKGVVWESAMHSGL